MSEFSRFIVSDPQVCHGAPTFCGTRILVADVTEQIVSGMAWDAIIGEWRNAISREMLCDAVRWQQAKASFPLRGTPVEMREPFEPAVDPDEWSSN